jgi:sec-independent protein translocase protein TatC
MWINQIFKFREKPESDANKPFLEHMEDLRWMLVRMAVAVSSGMALSFCFRVQLVRIVQHPLRTVDPNLVAGLRTLGVTDSLTISLQLAFYAGIVLSFPLLLFFLAQFVLPALTRQEKKYVLPAIGVGFGLFLTGVLFSYCFVLPKALAFFFHDAQSLEWTPTWTVREYFSFVTQITLAFGLSFELPVVVLVLVHLGFLSFEFLNRTRAYAIVLILILAMIIAPTPDVLTFLLLSTPMCLLYEACIWLAWLMERRKPGSP